LGAELEPSSAPSCPLVASIAGQAAREHARLAYVARAPVPYLVPTQARRPPNWGLVAGDRYALIPREEAGTVVGTIGVPRGGRYEVWLEGSFGTRMQVSLAGRRVGSVEYELGPPGQFVRIGRVTLGAGPLEATVSGPERTLAP